MPSEARIRTLIRLELKKTQRNTKINKTKSKPKRKTKRLMTAGQKKALIKAIGKNKSMKPSSRKAAIRKIRAKKTRK